MSLMSVASLVSGFPPARWPLLAAGVSLALLLGAWGFEYIGRYQPCALCYDQRYIHMGVIALGLVSGLTLIYRPGWAKYAAWPIFGVAAILAWSAGFSAWHAGIEWGWWAGPATCTSGGGAMNADPTCILTNTCPPPVLCDEAAWRLFGISMAGYNALISAGMAGLSVWFGCRALKR